MGGTDVGIGVGVGVGCAAAGAAGGGRSITFIVPTIPRDSWGMQISLYTPALSNVKVNNFISPPSSSTSMSRSSTVNVWNSVSAVKAKVTSSPTVKLSFWGSNSYLTLPPLSLRATHTAPSGMVGVGVAVAVDVGVGVAKTVCVGVGVGGTGVAVGVGA